MNGRRLALVVLCGLGAATAPLACGARTVLPDDPPQRDAAADVPDAVDAPVDRPVEAARDAGCIDGALVVFDGRRVAHRLDPATFASLRQTPTDCPSAFALAERPSDRTLFLIDRTQPERAQVLAHRLALETGRCTSEPARFTPGRESSSFTFGLAFAIDANRGEQAWAATWSWIDGARGLFVSAGTPLAFSRTSDLPDGPCRLSTDGADIVALCRYRSGLAFFVLSEGLTPIPVGVPGSLDFSAPPIVAKGGSVLVFADVVWRWDRATRALAQVGSTDVDVSAAAYARDCRP